MATIKGVWIFNDIVDPFTAPAENIVQAVNFTTADGVARTEIEIKDGIEFAPMLLNLGGWTVAIYDGGRFRWVGPYVEDEVGNQNFKTIDFGTTAQEVSNEFYALFTQIAVCKTMPLADKLVLIAENQQRVYDAGHTAGQAAGGGVGGLPIYETDMTFVSVTASVSITHNLGTQKFLLIGRVKEHDGTDLGAWKVSQVVAWSPYAYFQDAEYKYASGDTYNPYEYYVDGNRSSGAYIGVVNNGGATATAPQWQSVIRPKSDFLNRCTDNSFTLALNAYLVVGATWHFTVVDVSSIM